MKLVKTASGKQTIKLSRKEWQDIGKKAGWNFEKKDDSDKDDDSKDGDKSDKKKCSKCDKECACDKMEKGLCPSCCKD